MHAVLCCAAQQLNQLLDLAMPWTWVVHDPSGTSLFQNMDKVEVEYLE